MNNENLHLNEEQKLQAENDFLKMKLMPEHEAKFSSPDPDLPPLMPAVENEFLHYIIAFEEQAKHPKYIRIFDRIERPAHFKPATEIPDAEIEAEWEMLQDHLHKYQITLDVCSPNIPVRELYRFTVEELFEHEMDDMDVPVMTTGFIYDEFHPDPVYDNSRTARDCIRQMLIQEPLEWAHDFRKEKLRLNNHFPLTIEAFKTKTLSFKNSYDTLDAATDEETACDINEGIYVVTGTYTVNATSDHQPIILKGNWSVKFEWDEERGYWNIYEVQIEGIDF
ncbi:MAG: hypothetical protein J0H29_21085 [Sphingobacteriales bacterium]|nr:hypothetical protein [Sphingobacteriales bacterium]OJY81082.1 MAG: hypothetical protein BGP14_07630 [Sphingobacteriales bacterium 44-15]